MDWLSGEDSPQGLRSAVRDSAARREPSQDVGPSSIAAEWGKIPGGVSLERPGTAVMAGESIVECAGRASQEQTPIRVNDRRRYPRAEVDLVVLLDANPDITLRGTAEGLSPFGVKLRLHAADPRLSAGTLARLHCSLFDGEPLLSVEGLVWRVDPDGVVVVFVGLQPEIFSRLRACVGAHTARGRLTEQSTNWGEAP